MWWSVVNVARSWVDMAPLWCTLGKVTRRYIPLSGKKKYLWYRDHWDSLYQPKANHSNRLAGVGRMAYSDLDDVDYLVEDNVMDEFSYHRKWRRPMVEWHIGGASWEQNANAGNDSGNWGRTQQQRVNSLFWKIIALPRKLRANPVSADDNT